MGCLFWHGYLVATIVEQIIKILKRFIYDKVNLLSNCVQITIFFLCKIKLYSVIKVETSTMVD